MKKLFVLLMLLLLLCCGAMAEGSAVPDFTHEPWIVRTNAYGESFLCHWYDVAAEAGVALPKIVTAMEKAGFSLLKSEAADDAYGGAQEIAYFAYAGNGSLSPLEIIDAPKGCHAIARLYFIEGECYQLEMFYSKELVGMNVSDGEAEQTAQDGYLQVPDPMVFIEGVYDHDAGGYEWDQYRVKHNNSYMTQESWDAIQEYVDLLQSGNYDLKMIDHESKIDEDGGLTESYAFAYTGQADIAPTRMNAFHEGYSGEYHFALSLSRHNDPKCSYMRWFFTDDVQFIDPGVRAKSEAHYYGWSPNTDDSDDNGGNDVTPARDRRGSQCSACRGSGDCSKCGGAGYIYGYVTNRQDKICHHCNSSGRCRNCGGSGRQ